MAIDIPSEIYNFVNSWWQNPQNTPLGIAINFISTIAVIIMFAVGIFVIFRSMRRYSLYAGKGDPLGPFSIGFTGAEGYVHGNLSKNIWFNEDIFNKIKRSQSDFVLNFDEFQKKLEIEEMAIYDFKGTEHSRAWSWKEDEDVLVITNGKAESDEFSTPERKGRLTFANLLSKEYPKHITAISKISRQFEIIDPYGKKRYCWFLSLLPLNPKKIMSDGITQEHYEIVINNIGDKESIAQTAVNLPVLIKMQEEAEIDKKELQNYKTQLDKALRDKSTLNILLNAARSMLAEKLFVGHGKPMTPVQKATEIAWIIGAFFGGAFSYGEVPKYFINNATGQPYLPAPLVAAATFILILLFRELMKKKTATPEDAIAEAAQRQSA